MKLSHVHVGPGALTVLKRIFAHAPWSPEGMNHSKSAGRAAGAFVNELRRRVETHAAAQALRQCCSDLRICLPCSNDVEYYLSELRQLEHERPYCGTGAADSWYTNVISMPSFQKALGWEPLYREYL